MSVKYSREQLLPPARFGNVGDVVFERRSDGLAVQRTVPINAADMQVRLPRGAAFPWQPVPNAPGLRFRTVIPEGNWSSLAELAIEVRAAQASRGGLPQEDARIRLLKEVYKQLMVAVSQAHQQGCRLGLLDPTNVLFVEDGSAKVRVYLPDVGFVWQGGLTVPTHVTPQRWGPHSARFAEFRELWYPHPTLVEAETNGTPREEAIALSRMLGWVLSGKILHQKPANLPTDGTSHNYRSWEALAPFVDSRSQPTNVLALAKQLNGIPFWSAFCQEPLAEHFSGLERAGRGRALPGLATIGILLLLALVAAGVFFRGPLVNWADPWIYPQRAVANGVCPECELPGPFHEQLKAMDGEQGSFHVLQRILDEGIVGEDLVVQWRTDTVLADLKREDYRNLETKHFLLVGEAMRRQLDATVLLAATAPPETAQTACLSQLTAQLRTAIERTDSLMQWSEYYDRGLEPAVIQKIAEVAADFRNEFPDSLDTEKEEWPKFLHVYLRDAEPQP